MIQQLLMQFTGTLNRRRAYAATHPMVREAEERLLAIVQGVLTTGEALSIGVARSELLINGTPYETTGSFARELAQRLHRRGVGDRAGMLEPTVTIEQLRAAMAWLASDPESVADTPPTHDGVRITTLEYDHLVLDEEARNTTTAVVSLWRTLADLAAHDVKPRDPGGHGRLGGVEPDSHDAGAVFVGAISGSDTVPAHTRTHSMRSVANGDLHDALGPIADDRPDSDVDDIDTETVLAKLRISVGNPAVAHRAATALLKLATVGRHASPEVRDDIRAKVAGDVWRIGVGSALILSFIPLFIMLIIAKYYIGRSRRSLALADLKTEEAEISNVNRQVTEARLQALQAQVEPHFLYNTLANVQALTEVDPPAANQMVGHLIQYLRASLPKMRENSSTVGQEVERVKAYLNILKMRMGARLEFGIDVPDDLMTAPFPPMMLPSLVENAIKHGLEPQREGGRIDVIVTRMFTIDGDRIRLQVKDTGRGLSDAPIQAGGGVGLTNLRERLTALYGEQAKFMIESNDPKGVVATIELPATLAAQQAASPTASSRSNEVAKPPRTGWGRAWGAATKTHSAWARIVSVVFVSLMALLAVLLVVGLIALYTGWLPVLTGHSRLGGLEGMALGSVGLLIGFGIAALVVAIVVAIVYGLGFLAAGLLIFIPLVILVSLVPALLPFAVVGFAIYWFWWRNRKKSVADKVPRN